MAGQHSVLSPSSAVRRIICAGSLAAAKHLPPSPNTDDSASGTCTHQLAELCLKTGLPAESQRGTAVEVDGFTFMIDADRAERAQAYVDRILARVGRRMVEAKLDTSRVVGVPGQGGTADVMIVNRIARQVEVHDLKDGNGKVWAWMDPGEGLPRWRGANAQLMEYLAAALELADVLDEFDSGLIAIHQGRIGWYDEATFTRAEIEAWTAWAGPREQLAHRLWESGTPEEIRANLTPDAKACQWCPIRGECPARAEGVLRMFPINPASSASATTELPVASLTDAQLANTLERADEIIAFFRDAQSEALRRALAHRTIPGWKIVNGREGPRSYTDRKLVERALKDGVDVTEGVGEERRITHVEGIADDAERQKVYTEPELLSPTQAEKVLKKDHKALWAALQQFIERKPGNPSLVRDHDGRAPLNIGGSVEFGLAPVGAEDLL